MLLPALLASAGALASGCSQSTVIHGKPYDAVWEAARKVVLAYEYKEDETSLFGSAPRKPIHIEDKAKGRMAVSVGRFLSDVRLIVQVRQVDDGQVKVSACHYRGLSWVQWYRSRSQTQEARFLRLVRETVGVPAVPAP